MIRSMEPDTRDTPGHAEKEDIKIDRIEALRLAVLALFAALAGFALIYLLIGNGPSVPGKSEHEARTVQPDRTDRSDRARTDRSDRARTDQPDLSDQSDQSEPPPPPVPPRATPDGIYLSDDEPYYFRCWDDDGNVMKRGSCDRLRVFEKRLDNRLYVVHECKVEHAGKETQGRLSLGTEIDFIENSVSFWSGSSTEIEEGGAITTCLREKLAGIPIDGISHKYARYSIFFMIIFGEKDNAQATGSKKKPVRKLQ